MSSHEWRWVSLSSRHECLSLRHEWLWVSLSSWETCPMSGYECLSPRDLSGFECLSLRVISPKTYLVLQPSSFSAIVFSLQFFLSLRFVRSNVQMCLLICKSVHVCAWFCASYEFFHSSDCAGRIACAGLIQTSLHTLPILFVIRPRVFLCVCMRRGGVIENCAESSSLSLALCVFCKCVCACVREFFFGCVYLEKLINIAFQGEIGHELRRAEFLRSFKRICSVRVCILHICVRVCVYAWMRLRVHMRVCAWGFMCLHSGACVFVCV